tara:strand:- start:1045 stop:1443 length:399 start_codon:yes stop_codon:yes gene_type:complete
MNLDDNNLEEIKFIYDGECPFCTFFAELIELKSSLKNLQILDARKNKPLIKKLFEEGYDINKGSIIQYGTTTINGSEAVNFICKRIDNPSDSLMKFLKIIFRSKSRTAMLFPILVYLRKIILIIKRKPLNHI